MVEKVLKYYYWTKKDDPSFRDFFFYVTGIDPKPVYNQRKTKFLFVTDRLRKVEEDVLLRSNYKSFKILLEKPTKWRNHFENDIIGCVDYASHLPEAFKYTDHILRVDKQEKRFQFKNRKGLYRSDGVAWTRVAGLPRKKKVLK